MVAEYATGLIDRGSRWVRDLQREGLAMRDAVADDLGSVATVTMPSPIEVPAGGNGGGSLSMLSRHWSQHAMRGRVDAALIIAPESDGILSALVRTLRREGVRVLAMSDSMTDTWSHKWSTARWLAQQDVVHPTTLPPGRDTVRGAAALARNPTDRFAATDDHGWIIKPVDGCGSVGIRHPDQTPVAAGELMQRWVRGTAMSVAIVGDGNRWVITPPCRQRIENFRYLGGSVRVNEPLAKRCRDLVTPIVTSVAPMAAWFGVDLVLGDDPNDDAVIEINPRMTTSCIGLRRAVRTNLVGWMIGQADLPPPPGETNDAPSPPPGVEIILSPDRDVRWDTAEVIEETVG